MFQKQCSSSHASHERRGRHPESWLWETEEGRRWLTRLVLATLYTFGLKRGVGADTLSEFFVRLRLERQVGGASPSALRGVMEALVAAECGDGAGVGAGRDAVARCARLLAPWTKPSWNR